MKTIQKCSIISAIVLVLLGSIMPTPVLAHRNICHMQHSCPSDHQTYTCGDTGNCSQCPDNNYCQSRFPISDVSSTYTKSDNNSHVYTQSSAIPQWVKNNAKFWSMGAISETEFLSGIQYLVQNSVIKTHLTVQKNSTELIIPNWIKNNAKWWSEGDISDNDFVTSIEYLIKENIIQVGTSQCDQSLWSHVYHPDRLQIIENCKTVSGIVDKIIVEKDGDYHIRLDLDSQFSNMINDANVRGQHGDLVLEIICENTVKQQDAVEPCQGLNEFVRIPVVGQHVEVTGTYVLDMEHGGWAEIHPVSTISQISP